MLALSWHGWTIQVPLLYGKQYRLAGPRQIADHFEKRCQPMQKLIPADKHISDEVALDWDRLNGTLGMAVAVFAYYHLLPHRHIMLEPFSRGMPAGEQSFLKKSYPSFAGLFRLLLRLNAQHANESLAIIRSTIDAIDRRLKDGRLYLGGDRFTLEQTEASFDIHVNRFCSRKASPRLCPPSNRCRQRWHR